MRLVLWVVAVTILLMLMPASTGCTNVSAVHAEACGPWAVSEACEMSDVAVSPEVASRGILDHAGLLQSAGRVIVSAKITWPAEIPAALERHGLRVVRVADTDARLRVWLAGPHGPCIVLLSGGADVTAWHWRALERDEVLYDPRRVVEVYLTY